MEWPKPGQEPPEPNGVGEVIWLQPYPDILLEGLADVATGGNVCAMAGFDTSPLPQFGLPRTLPR